MSPPEDDLTTGSFNAYAADAPSMFGADYIPPEEGEDFDTSDVEDEAQASAFGETWEFDWDKLEFSTSGNEVRRISELDAFAEWAMNALHTERMLSTVYSADFGVEVEDLLRGDMTFEQVVPILEVRVNEALSAHDRFDKIENFEPTLEDGIIYLRLSVLTNVGVVDIEGRVGSG